MNQLLSIHPDNPQQRLIRQAADVVRQGGVIIYPTDSSYALGCRIGEKAPLERIRRLRQLDDKHNFTLICSDLAQIGAYARVDTHIFRLLKAATPGPYTFVVNATREVPRIMMHPKRRTIGVRLPANPIAQALLDELGEPLMSVTLQLPGDSAPMTEPEEIRQRIGKLIDLIVDGGHGGLEPSTVVDLTGDQPEVLRVGCGDPHLFTDD